jgi:hypothetical protein
MFQLPKKDQELAMNPAMDSQGKMNWKPFL